MKNLDLLHPEKLVREGIRQFGKLTNLYTEKKSEAKSRGELTFIGEKKMEEIQIQNYSYNENEVHKDTQVTQFDFLSESNPEFRYWLNLSGIHDAHLVEEIGRVASLDRLTIRQILDTTQRPKVEDYQRYLFFNVKSVNPSEDADLPVSIEQISFILTPSYVISLQEEAADHFNGIRNKIEQGLGLVRRRNTDFLLAQLLDAILDNYFETIEQINEKLEYLEREIMTAPTNDSLIAMEMLKNEAYTIRKALMPFRDALAIILHSETDLIYKQTHNYYKDLHHSANSALEETDGALRTLEGLKNIYFASLSQKMNETMKLLTIVATIFIPLTFIAGIYGMNFENIPELQYRYGYFITWGVMIVITMGMIYFLRKRKWV